MTGGDCLLKSRQGDRELVLGSKSRSRSGGCGCDHDGGDNDSGARVGGGDHGNSGDDVNKGDGTIPAGGADLEVNDMAENNNSSQGEVGPTQQVSSSPTDSIVDEYLPREGGNLLQNFDSVNQSDNCWTPIVEYLPREGGNLLQNFDSVNQSDNCWTSTIVEDTCITTGDCLLDSRQDDSQESNSFFADTTLFVSLRKERGEPVQGVDFSKTSECLSPISAFFCCIAF